MTKAVQFDSYGGIDVLLVRVAADGDTVAIAGAASGVGSIAVQLARRDSAVVLP